MSDAADAAPFSNFQNEMYLAGLGGTRPERSLDWRELERMAGEKLDAEHPRVGVEGTSHTPHWGYIAGSAGLERTDRANRDAFDRWRIVPRMLRDVSERSMRRTVLGEELVAPLLLAPIGVQTLVHPDGELAVARAAASLEIPLIASSAASYTFEQIAEASGSGPRWYQLYWPKDRDLAASFLRRAEASGYTAVVVTLDTWLLGWRPRDLTSAFLPFLRGEGNVNYLQDPVFQDKLAGAGSEEENRMEAIGQWAWQFANPAVTWEDLAWLREQTSLPIVLKGIQHPDDARLAVDHGVEGIIVSNHGGRQVDGAIGSLEALPGIVDAAGAELEILFDSGIRAGSDALKAIALGARAVCLGRPYMWGLTLGGEEGVREVLRSFLADLDLAMALSGNATIDDVGRELLAEMR